MTHDNELTQTDLLFRRMRFLVRRIGNDTHADLPGFKAIVHRFDFYSYLIKAGNQTLARFDKIYTDTQLQDVMVWLEKRYIDLNTPERHKTIKKLSKLPEVANVPGFPDYVVAYDGDGTAEVWSFAYLEKKKKHQPHRMNPVNKRFFVLYRDGKKHSVSIARVFALAFHGEPDEKRPIAICRTNGFYTPGSVVWVTSKEKQRYRLSKVTNRQRQIIVSRFNRGDSCYQIAKDYGITHTTVLRYVRDAA